MEIKNFAKRLSDSFPMLMREILRHENNYLTRGMITPPQFWALSRLSRQKTCQMHDLARLMNLKFSSATGLVDRMVRQGMVRRTRSDADRRAVLVTITAKGRKIFLQICQQKQRGIAKLFSRIGSKERGQYLEIIEKLVSSLSGETR